MEVISYDEVYEIVQSKQRELCPVEKYGRNYVYGTDREKYELPEEKQKDDDFAKANEQGMIKICSFEEGCKLRPDCVPEDFITNGKCILYGISRSWKGWG